MQRNRRLLIIIAGVILLFSILLDQVRQHAKPEQVSPAAGASASPLFAASFPDIHGKTQPLEQWRNQVIIVNFWASWCPPCREEMPELSALHAKYQSRGLTVLGISTDDAATMQQFASTSPVSYPLLAGDMEGTRLAEMLGNNRSVLPFTVILRRDGSLVTTYFGRINTEMLEQAFLPLL